ncbi:hypothetical protein [Methylogaea oryzae]|uniref:Uncharacterized protein n=1 Tax=Methylogaea oryzae TaxID=1295382 RepID=A0A8D4VTI9_9GAMM|nr:hypothetical protein [Methylogaea oryzae]BBL72040.1 hypothetical protein MoryE10_26460 [Methylogaea oryzae]
MKLKSIAFAAFAAVSLVASAGANAGADDVKWIAQCLQDNADAKVAAEVVNAYCSCMNNKMSENETKSISQWEKSHPAEMAACEKEAGWK